MRLRWPLVATWLSVIARSGIPGLGCSSGPPSDCASNAMCPAVDATAESADGQGSGDGGMPTEAGSPRQDAADATTDGVACDPAKSPHDDGCVIADAYGVFVSSSGQDTAMGTMTDPLRTVTQGIAKAVQAGKSRVYVCNGTYAEQVTLSSPVNLYGALACDAGWTYVDAGAARVSGMPNQIVLVINGVSTPIAIEDLSVTAANASSQDDAGNGQSSIAALVNASTVTFRRCAFSAGRGADGANGATGSNYGAALAPSGQPNDDAGSGGQGASVTCADGTSSTGGAGGNATSTGFTDGGNGTANPMPITYPMIRLDGLGGGGGINSCGIGDDGAYGAERDAGAGATTYGALTAGGWVPSAGALGQAGSPGQGGGGSSGRQSATKPLGGTGGGAGGCGGAGGTGGAGGGASIGLACVVSVVMLDACSIIARSAGRGGQGGTGQAGQAGGNPGTPNPVQACAGGTGGNGAGGGGGAGGTGGLSVCVVYKGSAPGGSPDCVTGEAGAPGIGGNGGTGGNGSAAPDGGIGLAGLAASTWQSP